MTRQEMEQAAVPLMIALLQQGIPIARLPSLTVQLLVGLESEMAEKMRTWSDKEKEWVSE